MKIKNNIMNLLILVLVLTIFLLAGCNETSKNGGRIITDTDEQDDKNLGKDNEDVKKEDAKNNEKTKDNEKTKLNEESDKTKDDKREKEEKVDTVPKELNIAVYDLKDPVIDRILPYTVNDKTINPEIMIPQITPINEEIENFNYQMKDLAIDYAETFSYGEEYQNETPDSINYESYKTNGVLTVIIKHDSRNMGYIKPLENAISIDVYTGKVLSNNELIERAKIPDFIEKLESSINDDLTAFKEFHTPEEYSYLRANTLVKNWNKYYGIEPLYSWSTEKGNRNFKPTEVYGDQHEAVSYLSESGELIYTKMIETPATSGEDYRTFQPVNQNNHKPEINPAYEHYAKILKIDSSKEDAPLAFIGHLGETASTTGIEKINSLVDESILALKDIMRINENAMDPYKFSTLYLIIPKYNDTCIFFSNANSKGYSFHINIDTMNTLFNTYQDHELSNCEVRVQHRDKMVIFKPKLDEGYNLTELPKEIVDISKNIGRSYFTDVSNEVFKFFEYFND